MNILYTITSYPPSMGGAQLYLHEIAKRAAGEHNIRVASFFDTNRNDWLLGTTLRAAETERHYTYEGVPVKQIYFKREEKNKMFLNVCTYYFNKRRNIKAIAAFIADKLSSCLERIDLIHNVRVGREPLSYASYIVAKRLNVPFLLTPLHHPRWSHWFYREYHELYRNADALFALTAYEKEVYKKLGVKEESIFVTGTGPVLSGQANPESFRESYNLKGPIVLFIGQGYRYKGISELLQAAGIVFKQVKEANFIFIGPHTAYSRNLFRKQKDSRIRHLGKVNLQTKTDALAACTLLCLPSKQESFGAVFLEAWSFKKPVIGLNTPQGRCLIQDRLNGLLVGPTPEGIAQAIIELLSNSGLRQMLGERGKETVDKDFTWDILYRKTINAYKQVLNKW